MTGFLTQPITIQSLLGQDRSFGPITVQVVIDEVAKDVLTITKQPVQTGAPISDHAFKNPTVFSTRIRFADNLFTSLSKVYQELLDLQYPPVPIDVVTPKRIYRNMLIASISQTTDKYTENVLAIDITFEQIILVGVSPTQVVPRSQQSNPQRTAGIQSTGKKSALLSGSEAIGGFFQ